MAKKRDAAKQGAVSRRRRQKKPVEVEAARPQAPKPTPIVVGIGASAGGLEPLQQFMDHMPPKSGVAFVVVQHLSPDFKSLMQELFSRHTTMTVRRTEDGMLLEPDCVYVIPPKKNLLIADGRLQLVDQDLSPGHRPSYPIDIFFESLAEQLGNESIGVVLSGTGTDGTRGIRAIHEAGGLVMAQDPHTAQFDGMPRSVIATGLADYILPPDEMARAIYSYVTHSRSAAGSPTGARVLEEEGRLAELIAILKRTEEIDFSHYKRSTLARRIDRRMVITGRTSLEQYVEHLLSSREERQALRNDLLIKVTSFFRDPEAWATLESTVVPRLVEEAPQNGTLRVWVTSCSSGEEAYSVAMLLAEAVERAGKVLDVKIFATDVDKQALETAAAGVYPESIVSDVPPERLQSHFTRTGQEYRINRRIREMLIFAHHNLVKDSPFTKMDLVSCRNVLIYMQPELQRQILSMLHFALRTQGVLYLGSAEILGDLRDEFSTIDAHAKLFEKRRNVFLPIGTRQPRALAAKRIVSAEGSQETAGLLGRADSMLSEAFRTIAEDRRAMCVLADAGTRLLHTVGETQPFLTIPEGRATMEVTKLVRRELAVPLSTALHRAKKDGKPVRYDAIRVKVDGTDHHVNLRVSYRPAGRLHPEFFIIILEDARPRAVADGQPFDPDAEAVGRIQELEQDLQHTRENLQATIEELETTNEEQQASNEELLASNEELQSTNEELHSVNEELYTVNAEHQARIQELTELNNDMDNLLRSTDIGTVFLDRELRVRKFTPAASRAINLMEADIGRPIGHFTTNLNCPSLLEDMVKVLETGQYLEQSAETTAGHHLMVRIHPYRTESAAPEGVVVTFVDVSELTRVQRALEAEERRNRRIVDSALDAVLTIDDQGRITGWNAQAQRIFGWSSEEAVGRDMADLIMPERHRASQRRALQHYLATGEGPILNRRVEFPAVRRGGDEFPAEVAISPLKLDGEQEFSAFVRDVTDRRQAGETRTRLAAIVESSEDTIIGKKLDGTITSWNAAAERMYGYSAAEAVGRNVQMLVPPKRHGEVVKVLQRLKRGEHIKRLETRRMTKDGRIIDVSVTFSPIQDADGEIIGAATIARDITDLKRAERRRREVTLALTNAMPGISRLDLEGRYEDVNDDYAAMLHTRAGALRGQAWKRTVHQDDRAAAQAASERSMKEGKAEFEATAVCADGSHFFAQVLMVRRDEDGRPAGHYCFMRDITDRKQAQIHLQLLQQVTEAISASPDLASAMSVALDRIRETTGWAFAEVWAADAGSDSLEYLCASYDPEPAFESFAASSMTMTVKRGQGLPGRVWSATEPELIANIREAPPGTFLRADTAARAGFTAAFAVPIVADGEVMAILVFFMRDPRKPHLKLVLDLVATVASQLGSVVRRKRVDEALKWANAELAHRNEHMNEFLYSISHDLKAPLVSIGGIAALLQEAMKDGDADGAEDLLETLERTTGTMHSTIDDLLELARSGSVSGKPEPVDLAEFVRDALARLDPVFRAKGFEVEVAGDLPRVSVDRDGFARVLDNILLNAIKYAADVPAPRIEIGARTSVEEHRLYIADNGPGIEPQHHERIFKPFQRLDSSREGTGIGLAIVRRIMAAHGGRAWVESETGSGTTFWLALPTRPPATVAIA